MSKKYKVDWLKRLKATEQAFQDWYLKFKVEDGIKYFEGFQWERFISAYGNNYTPYTVNLINSTIRIKRASLLFDNPKFIIRPSPQSSSPNFDPISSAERANLKSIAVNSFVEDSRNYFLTETKLALEDAFFGYGLIEVGYSANIIANPNAQKPAFDDQSTEEYPTPINEPEELPENERIFIKRIPIKQFRASGRNAYILQRANWVGYYEYYSINDAREAFPKVYKNEKVFAGFRSDSDIGIFYNTDSLSQDEIKNQLKEEGNLCKIWKFWDFRTKEICFWDETNNLELECEEFDNCHIHALVFDRARSGFLPIPPVFNWLSPQDEVNECSEQLRIHRRRANRKYIYDSSRLSDEDEVQKVINGPDGTVAKSEGPVDAALIMAVPMAPLDPAIREAFAESKDNFNIVTLTGSEQRGEVDRETATAAAIKNKNTQQAEAEPKDIVAEWLCNIARSIILNLARTTNPFWVKYKESPNEHLGGNIQPGQTQFKQISGEDIEGEDFESDIEISSISPIDNQAELQKLLQFLSVINQFQEVAISPLLVRTIATKIGITDEAVIAEAQKMAQMRMVSMMQQAQMGNQNSSPGAPAAQQINSQNTPSTQESIRNQLQGQLNPQ